MFTRLLTAGMASVFAVGTAGFSGPEEGMKKATIQGDSREAAPFMQQLRAPSGDGEVLVIEVDGKCPPIATEAELAKRRGKRKLESITTRSSLRRRGKPVLSVSSGSSQSTVPMPVSNASEA